MPRKRNRTSEEAPRARTLPRALAAIVALIAFLQYANTLGHEFTFDDGAVISENVLTQRGVAAIPKILSSTYREGSLTRDLNLYRPLSRVVFAAQWELFPGDPRAGHWTNVLLFSLTAVLLLFTIHAYGADLRFAFVATLLFVVHPIHTEVVASIKSLDEILAFLFFLVTMLFARRHLASGAKWQLAVASLAFFLALLSKESALTFLVVVPFAVWMFTEATRARQVAVAGALVGSTVAYFALRTSLLGLPQVGRILALDNVLYDATAADRFATAVSLLGRYLRLLVVPHPLVADYSYAQIPLLGLGDPRFWASLLALAVLGVVAVATISRSRWLSFGIAYFFLTAAIVSNVFFLIGTAFAERVMYAPSLGVCVVAAAAWARLLGETDGREPTDLRSFFSVRTVAWLPIAVLTVLFIGKSVLRNRDWHDNFSLFSADVQRSTNSARLHYLLGQLLSQRGQVDAGMPELETATRLYPRFGDAYNAIGRIQLDRDDVTSAEASFGKAIELDGRNPIYRNNYGSVFMRKGQLAEAKEQFEAALRGYECYADAYYNLGAVHGTQGQMSRGEPMVARSHFQEAITNFEKAVRCNPRFAAAHFALGMTYRQLGEEQTARRSLQRARELGYRPGR